MSSTRLDPVVVGKLLQFGRRRRRLLWVRGVCAGVVSCSRVHLGDCFRRLDVGVGRPCPLAAQWFGLRRGGDQRVA